MKTGYAFRWRTRDGGCEGVEFHDYPNLSMDEAKAKARRLGWPGHSGGRWDYFKDDVQSFWNWIRFGSVGINRL